MDQEKPFVFVHITDIHLQKRSEDSTYLNFRHFVKDVLPVIHPSIVINTGDITQSQEYDRIKILDHDEWILYSSVLKETGWFDDRKWLDVRGNHDSFVHYKGVHPYKQHTVFGSTGKGSVYSTVFSTDFGKLRFIGIDANAPLYRHFNGFLTKEMIDELEFLLSDTSIPTILFSHYPLFTMDMRVSSSTGKSFCDLLRLYKPLYYLCGHMHSALGGMIVRTKQYETIEAEQFDFKIARQFRIYSYYNNDISFTTYNINIDESPIVIIHSPADMRYSINRHNKHSNRIYFSVVNVKHPHITIWVDNIDHSYDIQMNEEDNQTTIFYEPTLFPGNHDFKCIVTNTETNKTTIVQRAFMIYSDDLNQDLTKINKCTICPLSHEILQQSLPSTYNPMNIQHALEYPTSSKVQLFMKIDWSKVMLYLNPLIITIIILVYWACRTIGFSILHKQSNKSFSKHLSSAFLSSFFTTDRSPKYSLFLDYFSNLPGWLQWCLSRLFLFTTDNLVYYGVLLAIFCRNFLPRFFKDDRGDICSFSILGYYNYQTKQSFPYMDTYVFGAAFFYGMMILFTVYMFLFASPSAYKNCHYPIVSYMIMMVDVVMMILFYKLAIQGRSRKQMRSLLSLLLQLTDDFSLIILFILMIREKCLSNVCSTILFIHIH